MMEFKHNDAGITKQAKDRPHQGGVYESMCWCLPVRTRFNALTQMHEVWDKDRFEWTIDPTAEQPKAVDQLPNDGGIAPDPTPKMERRPIPEPVLKDKNSNT
jgi:hypothetical protein